ncbi:DUF4011 domain-containing protein [Pirellulaceae bacterium SH501]
MSQNEIDIRNELIRFQSKLLDLSLRNPLLNYRVSKRKTVLLEGLSLDSVFHRLTDQFKPMRISARIPELAPDDRTAVEWLQAPYSVEELDGIARYIARDAKTITEETGINYLHLALGFLQWYEAKPDKSEPRLAPILLIPVEIRSRDGVNGEPEYFVAWDEDDIQTNPSLRKKLESDFHISFPERSDDELPSAFFASVQNAISGREGWHVLEKMLLGFFSFHKLSMYADIHPELWEQTDAFLPGSLPHQLFVGADRETHRQIYADDYYIDSHTTAAKIELPLEADSSQHSAITDIAEGKSLVIEGPPGTGKSQTIANAIAHAMERGQRVLFVAEKLAALEVVAKRLDSVGLGPYCLELHSHSVAPKRVFESLSERLHCPEQRRDSLLDATRLQLSEAKQKVESYLLWTNQRVGPRREPLYQLLWRIVQLRQTGLTPMSAIEISRCLSLEEMEECKASLNAFAKTANEMGAPSTSPWFGFFPEDLTTSRIANIRNCISQLLPVAQAMEQDRHALNELLGARQHTDTFLTSIPVERLHSLRKECRKETGIPNRTLADPQIQSTAGRMELCVETIRQCELKLDGVWSRWREDLGAIQLGEAAIQWIEQMDSAETIHALDSVRSWLATTRSIRERLGTWLSRIGRVTRSPMLRIDESSRTTRMMSVLYHPVWKNCDPIPEDWFLESTRREIRSALATHKDILELENDLAAAFQLDRIPTREELTAFLDQMKEYSGRWWRILEPGYRNLRKKIGKFATFQWFTSHSQILSKLESLNSLQMNRESFEKNGDWKRILGTLVKEADFHWDRVSDLWDRISTLQSHGVDVKQARDIRSLRKDLESQIDWSDLLRAWHQWELQFESPIVKHHSALMSTLRNGAWEDTDLQFEQLKLAIQQLNQIADVANVARSSPVSDLAKLVTIIKEYRCAKEEAAAFAESNDPREREIWSCVGVQGRSLKPEIDWLSKFRSLDLGEPVIDQLDRLGTIAVCDSLLALAESTRSNKERWEAIREMIGSETEMRSDWAHWAQLDFDGVRRHFKDDIAGPIERLHSQTGALEAWFGLCRTITRCKRNRCDAFVWATLERESVPSNLGDWFEISLLDRIAEEEINSSAIGQRFTRTEVEDAIAFYQKHDRSFQSLKSKEIQDQLSLRSIPTGISRGKVSELTELGLIKHEVTKKLRHCKIRDLMSRAGVAVQALKPCFLMSPLSLARYLPAESISFDLVIMDEASQIKPEDAIGAILRAKQLVVVGDPKQLPPTSFFDRQLQEESDTEQSQFDQAESILEVAMRAFQPCRRLRWHYRSRHEQLIRFSNEQFYDSDLIIFPSPQGPSAGYGIRSHFIEDGTFSNGVNLREGEVIAQAIVAHAIEHPEESLGVAAFNQQQAEWIDDQLVSLCRKDSRAMEAVARLRDRADGLFIKNLESIQGDERDVMFLSYTYGPDPTTGKVFQRFGPINFDTGWRRLNVLVTRSRKRMEVFSSLRFEQIANDTKTSRGVRAFRGFLEYVQRECSHEPIPRSSRLPESSLEESISRIVRSMGFEPIFQVGVSGCYLDVAVQEPNSQGEFLFAIESDGESYRTANSARDRDRIRVEVLRERGWDVHRIWSVDWYLHQAAEESRLRQALGRLSDRPFSSR